jgi:glycine oxidase
VYLVPRGKETVVGSTSERAGFDVSTTPEAIASLCSGAAATCPSLASHPARPGRVWAGIRPATPDMLPIIGPDPDHPELLYATGHSRNGILLAPATAKAVTDLALGDRTDFGLTGFGIARFDGTSGDTNLIDSI